MIELVTGAKIFLDKEQALVLKRLVECGPSDLTIDNWHPLEEGLDLSIATSSSITSSTKRGNSMLELIRQYTQDAKVSKYPFQHWQWSNDGIYWHDCDRTPSWYSNLFYRRLDQVKHKHADLMEEYLKDAECMSNPWTRWEYAGSINPDIWLDLKGHPTWQDYKYRRKLKPLIGETFYTPNLVRLACPYEHTWLGSRIQLEALENDLVFLKPEDAEKRAKAIIEKIGLQIHPQV